MTVVVPARDEEADIKQALRSLLGLIHPNLDVIASVPISAMLFIFAALRSAFLTLRDGGVTWRGTEYPLEELRKRR